MDNAGWLFTEVMLHAPDLIDSNNLAYKCKRHIIKGDSPAHLFSWLMGLHKVLLSVH